METTLQDIKNTYAQEQGCEDWVELVIINELNSDRLDKHWTEICIRAQKAVLEKAAENVKIKMKDDISELSMMDDWSEIDRTSITNPENLIR